MKYYLLLDFGSTYTKLTCVDIEKEEIVARAKDITTVKTGIINGYHKALKKLKDQLPKDVKFEKVLACSSAAGGLKMIAIGLGKSLTSEAAKRSALGAGARIVGTYSYELTDEDLEKIKNSDCDIILLCGGTEKGNKRNIIFNANRLCQIDLNIPIIVAGNSEANKEIEEIFNKKGYEYYVTENVMPQVNNLNALPTRETIRKIFMNKIVEAKGMNLLEDEIDALLMPTPAAVIKGAEILSVGTDKESGIGELLLVDVGGATTDVHSIGEGLTRDNEIRFEGLREPFAKRTVEGDLGMRYSAISLYEAIGEEKLKNTLEESGLFNINIYENCKKRTEDIMMIPVSDEDYKFDESMAKEAVELAAKRHCGHIRKEYSYTRYIYYQSGKNLRDFKSVIGTGGVIVHSKNPKAILERVKLKDKDSLDLLPENPKYYVDESYILSAMGLLAQELPEVAIRIMKKDLRECKDEEEI